MIQLVTFIRELQFIKKNISRTENIIINNKKYRVYILSGFLYSSMLLFVSIVHYIFIAE